MTPDFEPTDTRRHRSRERSRPLGIPHPQPPVEDYALVMAGALMSVIPLIVVFLFGARHFLRDLAAGAMKL
ncbi:hypothetical protein GCM10023097_41310 [Streptomyces collinus]